MNELTPILGSYSEKDCKFLMQEIETEYVSIEEKERRIQSGESHYSEMINKESAPSDSYMALFNEMVDKYDTRLANEVVSLAAKIIAMRSESGLEHTPVVLVSLARAGTPIGVLVNRAIEFLGFASVHYSISIIRDKGIDEVALKYLTDRYKNESIVFIDGWTAKGVITRELQKSVVDFNGKNNTTVKPELFVIADIGGTATVCSTQEDYAIPSSILNSTVSGLVSRTICSEKTSGGFHGCVKYTHLADHDISNDFIERIASNFSMDFASENATYQSCELRRARTENFVNELMASNDIAHINMIKPGIAEATRILLRRVPDYIMVTDINNADVAHLIKLAAERNVSIIENANMPFLACAVIKKVTD